MKRNIVADSSAMRKKTNIGNSLMNLPEEILSEILRRVPVKSICRLRCVCKSLLQILNSPYFISMHSCSLISTNNAFAEESQLMIRFLRSCFVGSDGPTSLQTADISSKQIRAGRIDSCEILSIQQYLRSKYVLYFCFHNFLFMKNKNQKRDGMCFLLDPFRGDILNLPLPQNRPKKIDRMYKMFFGMGFDHTNKTYKIIQIYIISGSIVAMVHELGTSTWREIQPPCFAAVSDFKLKKKTICAYGDVHWILRSRHRKEINRIYSFDFTKEEFYTFPHPEARSLKLDYTTLKGRLAVISLDDSSMEIFIMKDYSTKEWTLHYHTTFDPQTYLPLLGRGQIDCGEWDHGIYIFTWDQCYFLDLRERDAGYHPIYIKFSGNKYPLYRHHRIFELKRTLISLKHFQDPNSAASNLYTLLDFSKKYLWHKGVAPLSYRPKIW